MTDPVNIYPLKPRTDGGPLMDGPAEAGVLGAVLRNADLYYAVAASLRGEDFGYPVNGRIFDAIGELLRDGKAVDPVIVKYHVGEQEALAGHGGIAKYTADLIINGVAPAFLKDFIKIIIKCWQKRATMQSAQELVSDLSDPECNVDEALARHRSRIDAISERLGLSDLWTNDGDWTEEDIPMRAWVAPGYALRGGVTILSGPPSAMKSSMMLAWACAVALGRRHADFRPREAGKAMIYNCEDDQDEQKRRLSATLRQFNAFPCDIKGKVIRVGPNRIGTLFVVDGKSGTIMETPALAALRVLLRQHKPDLLVVDPLAELHTAPENDNTAMRAVVSSFRELAKEYNVAVVILHHTRKGTVTPGDIDASRGASALIGAGRVALTLTTMSEEDAEALGIDTDRATREGFIRLDDARQSYAAIGSAQWFQKAVYTLANHEQVAAAEPWKPPSAWEGMPHAAVNKALDEINAGLPDGRRFTAGYNAKETSACAVVCKHFPDKTDRQCRAIIKTWLQNGVLVAEPYRNPVTREEQNGLRVIAAKRPS